MQLISIKGSAPPPPFWRFIPVFQTTNLMAEVSKFLFDHKSVSTHHLPYSSVSISFTIESNLGSTASITVGSHDCLAKLLCLSMRHVMLFWNPSCDSKAILSRFQKCLLYVLSPVLVLLGHATLRSERAWVAKGRWMDGRGLGERKNVCYRNPLLFISANAKFPLANAQLTN